jgi:hypothetical protein
MSLIDKQNLRSIRSIPVHAAAIVVALALVMTFPSGMEMGLKSVVTSRDELARGFALADLEVRFLPEDVRNLPDFSDLAEVAAVEHRLLLP